MATKDGKGTFIVDK